MTDFKTARENMVDSQLHTADVTDSRILAVMGTVHREQFVPSALRPIAYMDDDIRIRDADKSNPARYLMEPMAFARLVQLAAVRKSDLVLDVGCGMGYSTAVLAGLADSVVALESDETLAQAATQRLSEQGVDNAAVVIGPLADGYPKQCPYNVIVLNGAVPEVPERLLDQLADGGRLVAILDRGPVGKAHIYVRHGSVASGKLAFDASVKPLPGFERETAFTF